MNPKTSVRAGFAWLELLLALAVMALLFQLLPSVWLGTLWALDIRNWPRTIWFAFTWIILGVLVMIRFGPDMYADWRLRRRKLSTDKAKKEKQQLLMEERELLARMKEAMKRRVI